MWLTALIGPAVLSCVGLAVWADTPAPPAAYKLEVGAQHEYLFVMVPGACRPGASVSRELTSQEWKDFERRDRRAEAHPPPDGPGCPDGRSVEHISLTSDGGYSVTCRETRWQPYASLKTQAGAAYPASRSRRAMATGRGSGYQASTTPAGVTAKAWYARFPGGWSVPFSSKATRCSLAPVAARWRSVVCCQALPDSVPCGLRARQRCASLNNTPPGG